MSAPRCICLMGPTGSGKTAAAIDLALALNGEIINADSRQVYRDFPIITAQPTPQEQAACPHHLYGFLSTEHKISAGHWAKLALACVREVQARGHVPILVGGTGLYIKALLDGIAAIPRVEPAISQYWQARCLAEGAASLHALLCEADPALAARLHPHDSQRIVRGLEVWQGTGKPLTYWHIHAAQAPVCVGVRLGLAWTLKALTPRLDARIEAMLTAGAVDEARAALLHCDAAKAPGWSGIGCAELWAYLNGTIPWEQARAQWLYRTRAYAKRQLTWFRADTAIQWYTPEDMDGLRTTALRFMSISVGGVDC